MKKYLSIFVLFLGFCLYAQNTVIFKEDFEETSPTLSQWSLTDLDGDGFKWQVVLGSSYTENAGFLPGEMAGSFGYQLDPSFPQGPLNPDNVCVTPAIILPALSPGETLSLSYKIGIHYDQLLAHNYAMYILPASQTINYSTATPVKTKNFTAVGAITEVVDLTSYAGQSIRIYFRHFNSQGQFVLLLDDVLVEKKAPLSTTEINKKQITIYPNPTADYISINGVSNIKSYEIFDMTGRKVVSESILQEKINVKSLSKGKYILTVKTDKGEFSSSFIKK